MTIQEITRLVREIQRLMGSGQEPCEEDLIDLAARHDELVEAVTERLESVERLLNKGQRSEAIELSEQEPNLNDVVTALDFPEFGAWNDLLLDHGIQPVAELPLDIATELNDAYSVGAPVERLLQRYRTQSLARSPLPERIETLRQLVNQDPGTAHWIVDLGRFETHRLGELRRDVQSAVKAGSMEAIAALDRELSSNDWTVKIPADLKKTVREAHAGLRESVAREELDGLSYQLSDAYADFDKATASRLRQRFLALAELASLSSTDPIYDIAGPALDWLQEEQRRAAAQAEYEGGIAQIEAALDGSTTIEELERLYALATRHGDALPEVLEQRLADRVETLRVAGVRKQRVIILSVVSVCVVAAIGVVLTVQNIAFQYAVAEHAKQATQLVQEAAKSGNLEPAENYFEKLKTDSPEVLQQPAMLGLQEQLNSAREAEMARRIRFEQHLELANTLGVNEARWENFVGADTELRDAERLARGSGETNRIANLKKKVQQTRIDMQKSVDAIFQKDLAEVVNQVAELPPTEMTGYPAVQRRLGELQRQLHVSNELKSSLPALIARVEQQRSMISANIESQRAIEKITDAIGNLGAYEKALNEFALGNPEAVRSADFKAVVQTDLPLWNGVLAWNGLRRKLSSFSFTSVTPANAQLLINEYETFAATSGPYPGRTDVDERINALRPIAARSMPAAGPVDEQIDRLFASPAISQAYVVDVLNDGRYYSADIPVKQGPNLRYNYYTTTAGTRTISKSILQMNFDGNVNRPADQWLSPQTALAKRLQPALKEQVGRDFEGAIAYGVETILQQKELDPLLAVLLVGDLLKLGGDGSYFVARRAEPHVAKLTGLGVSRLTNWAAPDDERAATERSFGRNFISANRDALIADLKAAVTDRGEADKLPVGPAMEWVGWLYRDAEGKWQVALRKQLTLPPDSHLLALGNVGSEGKPQFYSVATTPGEASGTIAATVGVDAKEGHPVYRKMTAP